MGDSSRNFEPVDVYEGGVPYLVRHGSVIWRKYGGTSRARARGPSRMQRGNRRARQQTAGAAGIQRQTIVLILPASPDSAPCLPRGRRPPQLDARRPAAGITGGPAVSAIIYLLQYAGRVERRSRTCTRRTWREDFLYAAIQSAVKLEQEKLSPGAAKVGDAFEARKTAGAGFHSFS